MKLKPVSNTYSCTFHLCWYIVAVTAKFKCTHGLRSNACHVQLRAFVSPIDYCNFCHIPFNHRQWSLEFQEILHKTERFWELSDLSQINYFWKQRFILQLLRFFTTKYMNEYACTVTVSIAKNNISSQYLNTYNWIGFIVY